MFFTTVCPTCGAALRLETEYAGHEAKCGRCGAVFVAAPAGPPPAPPEDRPAPYAVRADDDPAAPPPRRRDPDADDDWDDRPARRRRVRDDGSGYATAAMVVGIVSLFAWCIPPAGLVAGAVGVILGANGLQSRARPQAVLGIVFGLVGLIFSLGCGTLFGVVMVQENQADGNGPNRPPFFQKFKKGGGP